MTEKEAAIEEHGPHVLHMIAGSRLDILVGVDVWNREQFENYADDPLVFPLFHGDKDWIEYTGQDRIVWSEIFDAAVPDGDLLAGCEVSQGDTFTVLSAFELNLMFNLNKQNKVDARKFYESRVDEIWQELTTAFDSDFISFKGEGDAWICRIGYGLSND
jgi:hypothetical protein